MDQCRVLVIDNSALIRQLLTDVLASDQEINVVGKASNAMIAERLITKLKPDVVTLDLELPDTEGLKFLSHILEVHRVSVVVVSSPSHQHNIDGLCALELGATEWIVKPQVEVREGMEELSIQVCDAVKAAVQAKHIHISSSSFNSKQKLSADAIIPKARLASIKQSTEYQPLIAIGASTGGTDALLNLLSQLPQNMPGILVVQHMPGQFTKSFAERLNSYCQLTVKEAENGDIVQPGSVYIAPGDHHLLVEKHKNEYQLELNHGPLVCRHRPSVDALFRSAAVAAGSNITGVILTGMGDDGAQGMLEMKQAGAFNIAQDESTSVVYGMPKIAVERGGVDEISPLHEIPELLYQRFHR